MEIDCIHSSINMEGTQDECLEHSCSASQSSSDLGDIFGDQQVLPRVGNEYQAEIPSPVADSDGLQLVNIQTKSKIAINTSKSLELGLPIPIMWSITEVENNNGTVDFESSQESQITSNDEFAELKVDPVDTPSCYEKPSDLQKEAEGKKMEVDFAFKQESEAKVDHVERGFCPLPGSVGETWTGIERDSFLLGLFIFGKDLTKVKRFVGSKEMGDILSFYYGNFYRSNGYRRWSECRKQRSRRIVHGQKIFTGWRQQELLSRLFSYVSQDCHRMLLEVTAKFGEGKISFEEYVFTLKTAVGVNMLVEAVGISKGKQDLTGIAMEPIKPNQVVSARAEIPVGKACSTLTSVDIIKFLTGDFRLSKARCSDLFWEAVWPRLLERGWHSEQPPDHGISGSKHSLVFLVPGVKKFSRRRLIKGKHYFDSVTDVLNKVASDPGLLELRIEGTQGSQKTNEHGQDPPPKQDQDGFPNNRRHCYLQPPNSNCNWKSQKFTIVDTSLGHGAEKSKVRELRNLPVETSSPSASSSLSSETGRDTSVESEDELEETNTSYPMGGVIDRRTDIAPSQCLNSLWNTGMPNALVLAIAASRTHETQNATPFNDKLQRKTMKYRFSRKAKSGSSKYLVPTSKQQGLTACDHGDSSYSIKDMAADRKLNEEQPCRTNSLDIHQDMVLQVGQPQNSSSASSLAKCSPDRDHECFVGENCMGAEAFLEKPQSPNLIDLNIPHVLLDLETDGASLAEMASNINNAPINESPFESEISQKSEPLKLPDSGIPPGQKPFMDGRRQSTRNRPLTTKALEAIELGFMNTKKRKNGIICESNLMSSSSRRVRGKNDGKATCNNDAENDVASSRIPKLLDHSNATNV